MRVRGQGAARPGSDRIDHVPAGRIIILWRITHDPMPLPFAYAPVILFRFVRPMVSGKYRFVGRMRWSRHRDSGCSLGRLRSMGSTVFVNCGVSARNFVFPTWRLEYFSLKEVTVALVRILCIAIATIGALAIFDEFSRRFVLRNRLDLLTGYHKTLW